MTYYLLPKTNSNIFNKLECISSPTQPEPVISFSLSHYLYEIKKKLEEREKDWDTYKKYTNPYEYIHSYIPNYHESICKHSPLSRSYYKMIEIMNTFTYLKQTISIECTSQPIKSFHIAEGPGGFIEALAFLRKCPKDKYIGMTLLDKEKTDTNIPSWKKSSHFLNLNKNT